MKRITFLAALVIAIAGFNTAKAQVGVHIGVNIGRPAPVYYAPAPRVVVVDRPHYYRPAPVYYDAPRTVIVRQEYRRAPRRVVVIHDRHHGRGIGHGHGHGRW